MTEIIVILLSLAAGSFANNVVSYYSRGSKFDLLRSACMCGEKSVPAGELLPVLSYILLKGKCSMCSEKIPYRYIIVEIAALILGLICYSVYSLPEAVFYFVLFIVLFLTSVIDYLVYKFNI